MTRLGGLAALAASVLLLAACGGDEGAPSAGAELVPADVAFAVVANTDFESGQWQAANALIEKFPGGRGGVQGLFALQGEVDFEQDVEPALGPEVVVAGLDAKGDAAVVLTQPDDPAKFEALVAMGDEPAVARELSDGWWAAASSAQVLDRFQQARDGEKLGDSEGWKDATGDLPEETLATVYVAAGSTQDLEQGSDLPPEAAAAFGCLAGKEQAPGGFAVVAEEDGVRFEGSTPFPEGFSEPDAAESDLAGLLPEAPLAVFSARSLGEYMREVLRCATEENPDLATQLAQLELGLGLSLEEDLLPLLAGETAVGVYPGQGAIPSVLAVTQVEDENAALQTVDTVLERARLLDAGLTVEDATVDGLAVRRVSTGDSPVISYAALDGILVFGNVEADLAALQGDGPSLADDAEYKAAREAAGAPAEDAGYLYVDAQRVVELLASVLAVGEVPVDVSANLEPLKSLLLWGVVDDGRATVEGFLRID